MYTPKGKYDLKLLKSIKDFYVNKTNKIQNDDNILIKYLKSPYIIRDLKTDNLTLFIKELFNQIEISNIILPFIEPIGDLIDIYLNDTNNKIDKNIWEKLFVKLIENSFFNKENLIPIYSYFTELYSEVNDIKNTDEKISKFNKAIDLWKLIYLKSQNKHKENTYISSFCSLGTGLELILPKQFHHDLCLNIRINFMDENFLEYINPKDFLIIIDKMGFQYNQINMFNNFNKIKYIDFRFGLEYSKKEFWILINNNDNGRRFELNENNPRVTILNNFYGRMNNIRISFCDYSVKKEIKCIEINPFPLKDREGIIFNSHYTFTRKLQINQSDDFNPNIYNYNKKNNPYNDTINFDITIKAENFELFKANYINFMEKSFNTMNYLGGIIQFLPFLNIINGLYKNQNIISINMKDKNEILIDFAKNILLVIYKYINNDFKEKPEVSEKYLTFFFYVINKIEPFNLNNIKINLNVFDINRINYNIYSDLIIRFLSYINTKSTRDKDSLKNLIKDCFFKVKGEKKNKLSPFWKTNNQLYRHLMKQLFIYNRLWSKQYTFFKQVNKCYKIYNNKENPYHIKYKRINYYTTNFQQPLIYPILELTKYIPLFTKFNPKENLYKNQPEKIIDYYFSLDEFENCLDKEYIENYIDIDNNDINKFIKDVEECCLVKRMYHVKGKIICIENNNNDIKNNFVFCFLSDLELKKGTCNGRPNNELCYGSIFSSMKKEYKRYIYIPKEKIVFAILRVYYHRISGLEIFTSDNKSYYFNFKRTFGEIIDKSDNKIIYHLNKNFEIIKKNDKHLGWFNKDFKKLCFPLFSESIDKWNEKHVYSNFDKLMIINLFSNRSFHDLNQYPVFPMMYNEIGYKRTMNKPIGFQELEAESINRTQLIKDSYFTEKDFNENDNNDISYFSILFSNISFVCNYLIRVYPYSFLAVEIQGDRFDTPERLFYSISSMMRNTLSQRSDLRELIPEMYYFPPLFSNLNDINIGKLREGTKIDTVSIKNINENSLVKYTFLKNMRNNLENEQNLNKWIDLIFGINKEFDEKKERYYSINNNVDFIEKPEIINDDLKLQACDFGVLPTQLFSDEFPEQNKIKKDLEKDILTHNHSNFTISHLDCLTNDLISFICKGEKGINSYYNYVINRSRKSNIFVNFWDKLFPDKNNNNIDSIHYLFLGDVFGNLYIYKQKPIEQLDTKIDNLDLEEDNQETESFKYIKNQNYVPFEKLFDHTKEIIYIDYNPRLNLFADYSLDGFINIYTMPTLKLVRVIQTKDFDIPGKIYKIALISNPFPMICCVSTRRIFIWDINGDLVNSFEINERIQVEFCIDKCYGRFNDHMIFIQNGNHQNVNFL